MMPAPPAPPPNAPAHVIWNQDEGRLRLRYNGGTILDLLVRIAGDGGERVGGVRLNQPPPSGQRVLQRLELSGAGPGEEIVVRGSATGSDEAFPAETAGPAQERFAMVRTSSGLSANLRNNAVYDRRWDWMLAGPGDGATRITPERVGERRRFGWSCRAEAVVLEFRPAYYRKHRGLERFEPWTYRVRQDSITGWCSWWAYRAGFNQHDLDEVSTVMAEQRFADFGYRFLQIDDAYQGGSGTPESWLKWNDRFPRGMAGYVDRVHRAGLEPAIWVGVFFRDRKVVDSHLDWFVRSADGSPRHGPWVEYGIDATAPGAAEALVRPTYQGIHQAGFTYVKIDALRHLLYDSLHSAPGYSAGKGLARDAVFRRYLEIARAELGAQTFVLACWGVLPEAIGLVDGCRLGGDGFGPATLQQYASFNGVVWRNDPDHCDVLPEQAPAEAGNVTRTRRVEGVREDTIARPGIVSMAGAMLMLSDRAGVYRDPANLEGLRRASPVLFTVPGQLYDYDPRKSDRLATLNRADVRDGGPPAPADADQFGQVCPWWMMELDRPFERWNVLARLNWTGETASAARVSFRDLGLESDAEWLVYEFWTRTFVGAVTGSFEAAALPPGAMRVYVIRRRLDRPQVLSTNRHITHGGVDMERVRWDSTAMSLSGTSRVVREDPYTITVHTPPGYRLVEASFGRVRAAIERSGPIARVTITPGATGTVNWVVRFGREPATESAPQTGG